MKRITTVFLILIIMMIMIVLPISSTGEGGLLPSLTETVGIAMPSLGEALGRYPDGETENEDGSVTELYTNVSETDFNVFSVYLEKQEAELANYKAEKGVLTAEIRAKGASFSLQYDSKTGEAKVTYPASTFDEWTKNAKTRFETAQKLLAEEKTDEAYAEIFAIPRFSVYGPVDILMKEDENFAAVATAEAAREAKYAPYRKMGSVVTFGTYPQMTAGKDQTPIEWIVLDYDDANNKALLLSKYALDMIVYDKNGTDITWERCTLRYQLNGGFLYKAFSEKERSAILITDVDNSSDQGYSKWNTYGGNNTQDRVFLLSYAEANRYLGVTYEDKNNMKSRAVPTAYAIAKGKYQTAEDEPAISWWLRSPGTKQDYAAAVYDDGSLHGDYGACNVSPAVRPALWLNLDSDIF